MEISNKTLAIFLLIATSASLVGVLLSLGGDITGRATTDTGTSNFSINSTVSVVFTSNLVEFGVGVVNASGTHNCTLNTSGEGMLNGSANPITGPDCIGFNATIDPLRIQNQGSQNVTLNISFNATAASFVGGTTPGFTFRATNNETGACGNTTTSSNLFLDSAQTEVNAAATNFSICNSTGFNWLNGNRTLNIDLGIRIPQDVPSGAKRVTITAYAAT